MNVRTSRISAMISELMTSSTFPLRTAWRHAAAGPLDRAAACKKTTQSKTTLVMTSRSVCRASPARSPREPPPRRLTVFHRRCHSCRLRVEKERCFTHTMDLAVYELTNIGGYVLPGSGRTLAQPLLFLRAQRDRDAHESPRQVPQEFSPRAVYASGAWPVRRRYKASKPGSVSSNVVIR